MFLIVSKAMLPGEPHISSFLDHKSVILLTGDPLAPFVPAGPRAPG